MTKQENFTGYKFTLLSEDLASSDLFEDKTHERVSENLYNIIQQSNKSVTIGLEGSWGSGKSMVIKLLKDKLKNNSDDNSLLFMFDAWAHDGDPLRRIFLETLIREIDPDESSAELNDFKKKITGKSKIVTVTSKKTASRLGKFVSFFALLIPLGSALLARVNYDLLVSPLSREAGSPYWQFIAGLLLCLSPVLVLIYWIANGDKVKGAEVNLWKKYREAASWSNIRETLTLSKIRDARSWEFFSVDSTEDYTQDITEDGERTSIEFEDYFKCIINIAMEQKLLDRCIIVVDNLDRVDPEHAKNIWSTLQTFFQNRSKGDGVDRWSDKVWFVIPFDREGFNKIWKSSDGDSEAGKSFLKKCFQLIAEVPHPVMSGWSSYAEKCINEALNQWPEEEKNSVLSTYIRYASRLDQSPTPRDIKVFSNQVGLLGAMWGGSVSVEAMCLYTLFKDFCTTNELRRKLVSRQLPSNYKTEADPSFIFSELAGLLFGVNRNKGLQLLLGPEIKAAFSQGSGEILKSLLKDHGEAFWIAYESSRSDWNVVFDHTDEYKISATKAFKDGLFDHKNRIRRDIVDLTDVWIQSLDKLDFSNFNYSITFNSLIDLSLDREKYISTLFDFMKKKILQIVNSVGSDKFPENILPNVQKVADLLANKNKALIGSKYPHLTIDNWKLWISHLEKSKTKFSFVLPKDETIKSLVNEAQLSATSPSHETLRILLKTFDIYPSSTEWEIASDSIVDWMAIRHRGPDNEAIYDLSVKLCLSGKYNSLSRFEKCLEGSSFWAWAQNETCDKNPSLPILTAITLKEKLQDIGHVSPEVKSFWSNDSDTEKLKKTFDRLKALNSLGTIWELLQDGKNKAAEFIVKNIDDKALFRCWQGVYHLDSYDLPDDEINKIAIKLAENGAFFLLKNHMVDNPLTYQSIYKIFYSIENSEISKFIEAEVIKLSTDLWKQCIEEDGDFIDLVNNKNPHFSKALNDYCISIVSGTTKLDGKSSFVKKLSGLLDKVTDLNKSILPKVIRSYFDSEIDHLDDEVFNVLSPLFSRHLGRVEEVNLMERLCAWINSNQLDRIKWLMDQDLDEPKDPSENLIELVKLWLDSNDVELSAIAIKIKDKFGLTLESHDIAEGE